MSLSTCAACARRSASPGPICGRRPPPTATRRRARLRRLSHTNRRRSCAGDPRSTLLRG
jgi:hypothetical protein